MKKSFGTPRGWGRDRATPRDARERAIMGAVCGKTSDAARAVRGAGIDRARSPPGRDAAPVRGILKNSSLDALAGGSAPTTPTGSERDRDGGSSGSAFGSGMTRKSSFVHFTGLDDDEDEEDDGKKPGGFFARAFGDHRAEREDAKEEMETNSTSHARTGSITTSVPVAEHEEETHWFLSIGVDTRHAAARVMESRLAAAKVEEQRLIELVVEAERATEQVEAEARRKNAADGNDNDSSTSSGKQSLSSTLNSPAKIRTSLMPWDVMVTVARAREGDARTAARKATLVVKKLAHAVALWELKSAKRASADICEHLKKTEDKKGRRMASAARARVTFTAAEEDFNRENEKMRVLEDRRLAADANMAGASARIHAARTSLQNARDRKRGILSTFRQAVRNSMDSSVELLEFRQKEFALRASNVTKTMFTAYDEMTTRLEETLMNAIDAVSHKTSRKKNKVFDIEAAAALTARDRAEASLNDAASQSMAEMRALEASTRTLLASVDEEIKNGIEEFYAAADDERVCYLAAQQATIACKMALAAVKVYEEQYNATKSMWEEADKWANSLDDEIETLARDAKVAEERHAEASNVVGAALKEVEDAEKEVDAVTEEDISGPNEGNANPRQSVRNVFEVINRFSMMVRDKSGRGQSDTVASLKELSIQAGSDSPRVSGEVRRGVSPMLRFSTTFPDADATMESIMERAEMLQRSSDVQALTRNVSRDAMAYNPLQK